MAEKIFKVKVNVENNIVVDKTEEKKLCKILVSKGDKGEDGSVNFNDLTDEQKASLKGDKGDKGDKGEQGERGEQGKPGVGLPEGGKQGQILAKMSDDDYDTEWIDNEGDFDLTEYAKKDELPTKVSELENDSYFLAMNDDYSHITGRLHVSNNFDDYLERKVDISARYLMGAENGGLPSTLYINDRCDTDVRILRNGTGTLYYKEKEVATQEYVNEQISNIEINGGNQDLSNYALKEELPTKTSDLENDSGFLTENEVEEKGYATKDYVDEQIDNIEVSGGVDLTDYATKEYVDEKIENIEISGGGSIVEGSTVDTLPIGSVVMFNGDEIPDGYIELEDYEPTYSLEEKRVGTWINGKPIYRRVVEFTFSSTKNTWNLVVSQPFTSLVNCYGYLIDTTVFMNFPATNGNEVLSVYGDGTTGFYEKHNYDYPCGKSGYLIIEYTKTTD